MKRNSAVAISWIGVILLCFLKVSSISAKNYYLSRKGNDANIGTSTTKTWLSIAKINTTKLNPGDSILFQASDTFVGNIYIPGRDSGTAAKPVVFSSYGSGKAAINAKDGNGFYIYNAGGIVIQNLDIYGSGVINNKGDGVFFYTDTSNGHKFKFIRVINVNLHDFGDCGILMGSYHNSYPGYTDINFDKVTSYDNKKRGIFSYDMAEQYSKLYAHKNMRLTYCTVLRNGADGITISGVDSGFIEHCRASFTGINTNNGDAGIWVYSSNKVTIQYCISDHTYTVSGGDGEGFDLDGGTQNCVIQYCYAYQNSACGFMHCDYPTSRPTRKNVIRYCLSENDGRKAANYNSSFLFISWGTGLDSCYMHNNSAYVTDNANGSYPVSAIRAYILYGYDVNPRINHCQAMNNIYYVYGLNSNAIASFDGGTHPIKDSNLLLTGNCYYAPISNSRRWVTESKTYTVYKNWQDSAGQEMLAGARKGYYSIDPLWQNAGKAGAFTNTDSLAKIIAYRLQSKSPIIGKGLNIDKLIPIKNALYDYYKDTLYPYHLLTPGMHEPQPPGKPVAGFYAKNACLGDSIYFNDTTKYAISYHWDFGDKDTSADINPSHYYKKAGKYLVTLIARSVYGKTDTFRRTVEQYAVPIAVFTTANTCQNSIVQIKNNSNGASIYHWDFGDGDTSNLSSPTHSYKKAGTYSVLLSVKTTNGCKDTVSHSLQVFAMPKAKFSAANVCLNNTLHITNASTGAISYRWGFGDGDSSSLQNPDHLYKVSGTYSIKLQARSANGCIDTTSRNLAIYPLPIAQFNVSGKCVGSLSTFKNSSIGAGAYYWQFGDGDVSSLQSPAHIYKNAVQNIIKLVVTSPDGCLDTANQTIQILSKPIAKFSAPNTCEQLSVPFKDSSIGAVGFTWYFGDGDSSKSPNPSHVYKISGTYHVVEKVSNAGVCADTATKALQIYKAPMANWTMSNHAGDYNFEALDTSLVAYRWDFGDSSLFNGSYKADHNYKKNGNMMVSLTVRNDRGCESTDKKEISVQLSSVEQPHSLTGIRLSPNPFARTSYLRYGLDKPMHVIIKLYSASGVEIGTLSNNYLSGGGHECVINATDLHLLPGVYLLRLQAGDYVETLKLIKTNE